MKPWHGYLLGGIAVIFAYFWKKNASASTLPREDGTLPDVPGLRDRETKEPGFVNAFLKVIRETNADGDKLAAIMSEESGFNPQAKNPIGAVGLLQWIPKYASAISGHTTDQLYGMTATQQLEAVRTTIQKAPGYRYDPAMQGWGGPMGVSDDHVLASTGDVAYEQNKNAYDKEGKGHITAGDVRAAVYGRLNAAATKPRVSPT